MWKGSKWDPSLVSVPDKLEETIKKNNKINGLPDKHYHKFWLTQFLSFSKGSTNTRKEELTVITHVAFHEILTEALTKILVKLSSHAVRENVLV